MVNIIIKILHIFLANERRLPFLKKRKKERRLPDCSLVQFGLCPFLMKILRRKKKKDSLSPKMK